MGNLENKAVENANDKQVEYNNQPSNKSIEENTNQNSSENVKESEKQNTNEQMLGKDWNQDNIDIAKASIENVEKIVNQSENSQENSDENINIPKENGEDISQNNIGDSEIKLSENKQIVDGDSPEYSKGEWQDKTRRFLEDYPLGRSFVEQIGEEIARDDTLSHNSNCLEIALARVLSKAYMSPKDIINNQEFREKFVYDNVEIKSVIIDKYLRSLDEQKPPATMESGGQILFVPPDKPKSIDEAGELVRKMLKNRRN